ncbi:MAG: hypothetical protein EPN75_02925 [Beijerinckiaceae bacterium]|nr:MAG: hypothetical protein EPN75_02925 [Beijerinckiaceae bacterium]
MHDYNKPDPALEHSKYADLNSRAVSDEAKAFIEQLASLVEDQEIASGLRSNRRRAANKVREHRQALGAFVGDLLAAGTKIKAAGWCHRSLKAETFTRERVSYRTFVDMLAALKDLGYVEHREGQQRLRKFGPKEYIALKGMASRFRATSAFLRLAKEAGIYKDTISHHFIEDLPQHPLVLKASSKRIAGQKAEGKAMRITHTQKSLALEEEVRRLNKFLDGFDIRGAVHKGYRRIFNQGDVKGFDWDRGGRLYGGDESYQRQSKDVRLKMTINDSSVVEIDISASYLTLLHGLQGLPFDPMSRDPYEVEGVKRAVVKAWTTATLGNQGHLRRWPKDTVKDFEEETGYRLPDIISVTRLRAIMEERHPVFLDWEKSRITWADLMFHESQAVVGAMLELMDRGLPSLCVHDSLLVRIEDQDKALKVLVKRYEAVSKIKPRVKINTLTSSPLNGSQ